MRRAQEKKRRERERIMLEQGADLSGHLKIHIYELNLRKYIDDVCETAVFSAGIKIRHRDPLLIFSCD